MTAATNNATLSLGPVQYLWAEDKWRDFYYRIADEAPISHVTIGEIVCSKRFHFTDVHLPQVIERLERAGKQVRVGSLALVALEREIKHTRALAECSDWIVEANDISALQALRGKTHAVGPLINVYNAATARLLAKHGAESICVPPELPLSSIELIASGTPETSVEVFVFGRMPLAISARCAHARSRGLIKDNCQFVCGDDPDGLTVKTMSHQPFLTINGVQTLSFTCQALVTEIVDLTKAGVQRFRLSPQDCDMVEVAHVYADVVLGSISSDEALDRLRNIYPFAPLSNGFIHAEAGATWIAKTRNARTEE